MADQTSARRLAAEAHRAAPTAATLQALLAVHARESELNRVAQSIRSNWSRHG